MKLYVEKTFKIHIHLVSTSMIFAVYLISYICCISYLCFLKTGLCILCFNIVYELVLICIVVISSHDVTYHSHNKRKRLLIFILSQSCLFLTYVSITKQLMNPISFYSIKTAGSFHVRIILCR